MRKLPHRTQVQIIKPDNIKNYSLRWYSTMDEFIGIRALVNTDYLDYIILMCPGKINVLHAYDWHPDWVKVISKDKDGNPEPYDNQGRGSCYWCGTYTETIIFIREDKRKESFHYCSRCKR